MGAVSGMWADLMKTGDYILEAGWVATGHLLSDRQCKLILEGGSGRLRASMMETLSNLPPGLARMRSTWAQSSGL